MEEASVAGESPDRSKKRESSAEATSGSTAPVPEARTEARDPRLTVARDADASGGPAAQGAGKAGGSGGVDTATRVFSVRDPGPGADEGAGRGAASGGDVAADATDGPDEAAATDGDASGTSGDARLRAAVAAWVRSGDSRDSGTAPGPQAAPEGAGADGSANPEGPDAAQAGAPATGTGTGTGGGRRAGRTADRDARRADEAADAADAVDAVDGAGESATAADGPGETPAAADDAADGPDATPAAKVDADYAAPKPGGVRANAGDGARTTAGDSAHANAGDGARTTAGDSAHANAGDGAKASADATAEAGASADADAATAETGADAAPAEAGASAGADAATAEGAAATAAASGAGASAARTGRSVGNEAGAAAEEADAVTASGTGTRTEDAVAPSGTGASRGAKEAEEAEAGAAGTGRSVADGEPEEPEEPEDARPARSERGRAEGAAAGSGAGGAGAGEPEDARPAGSTAGDGERGVAGTDAGGEPEDARPAGSGAGGGEAGAVRRGGSAAGGEPEDARPAGARAGGDEGGAAGAGGSAAVREPEDARPAGSGGGHAGGAVGVGKDGSAAGEPEDEAGGSPGADGDGGGKTADARQVDQPTAVFKRPARPQVDQPTTMLKLGGAAGAAAKASGKAPEKAPEKAPGKTPEAERTSKFVALKPLDEPSAKKPADATAVVPQVGPERTAQQPLPPKPPMDLLAELTNTPPPPETPVRTVVRRVKIWTPLVLLLAVVFAIVQAVRPLPTPTLALTADDSYTFAGSGADLPWPNEGEGWMDVNGIGTMGNFGKQTPVAVGSVAKAMTAYLVLKDHPLKPGAEGVKITVDATAEKEGGYYKDGESTLNTVKKGDVLTEKQALSAVMVPSANNIARLLARWDAGSEAAFIKKMNDTARKLGMNNTTYTDASGLKESTVSTAEDQVKLGNELVKMPALMAITKLPSWVDPSGHKWRNYNSLVPYNGAIGIKTGTTTKAGGNLLFAATKKVGGETVTVVGAILGQHTAPIIDTVNKVSKTAMIGAQDALTSKKILKKGDVVGYVDDHLGGRTPIVLTKDVTAVGWSGLKVKLSFDADDVPHSAKAGTQVGTLTVGDGTSGAVKVPVALQKDLTEPGFGAKLKRVA